MGALQVGGLLLMPLDISGAVLTVAEMVIALIVSLGVVFILCAVWKTYLDAHGRRRIAAEQVQAEARLQLMTNATLGRLLQAARDEQVEQARRVVIRGDLSEP